MPMRKNSCALMKRCSTKDDGKAIKNEQTFKVGITTNEAQVKKMRWIHPARKNPTILVYPYHRQKSSQNPTRRTSEESLQQDATWTRVEKKDKLQQKTTSFQTVDVPTTTRPRQIRSEIPRRNITRDCHILHSSPAHHAVQNTSSVAESIQTTNPPEVQSDGESSRRSLAAKHFAVSLKHIAKQRRQIEALWTEDHPRRQQTIFAGLTFHSKRMAKVIDSVDLDPRHWNWSKHRTKDQQGEG
ncbi:hypothetical protein CAEBREN_23660 [Caenorhabditis brenneri]|uniref:Uncharacterized protein n=1 Tax=Caenorhabditis brenneri TaxID=135651 RepID=G0NKR7_CAEBE|nr:hypothetical protein CAEBREN_23660 [Caenorhabditis brenneri]